MSANNNNKNTAKYNNKNQNKVPTPVQKPNVSHHRSDSSKESKWNNSIFIPAIPFAVTKNDLKDAMESNIGTVHRIDFATFNSDNGSGRRAFVHFDHTYQTDFTKLLRQEIAHKGHFDVYYPMYKMNLRIMMNKNPVPETDKTIHQVASDIDFMGEKIRLHEETFLRENEKICDLQKEIQNLQEENKSMKQFMENMFHSMKSQEAMIQTLANTVSMQMQPVFMPMPMMPMPGYYPIHQIPMEPNLVVEEGLEYYSEEREEREEGEEPEEYQYDSDNNDNYCESCDARLSHKGYAYCDMCDEKSEQKQRYMKKAMKKGKMELSELM